MLEHHARGGPEGGELAVAAVAAFRSAPKRIALADADLSAIGVLEEVDAAQQRRIYWRRTAR